MSETPAEQSQVMFLKPVVKFFKRESEFSHQCPVGKPFQFCKAGGKQRSDGEGDKETHQCCRNDHQGKLPHNVADQSADDRQGEEHYHVHQRDRQCGKSDLVPAAECGKSFFLSFFQMMIDIFEHNNRIVYQYADHQRQTKKRHQVQRKSERIHCHKRGDQRRGNGNQNNE